MKRSWKKLPVLHLPNNKDRFHSYSDTSKFAKSRAFYQMQDGKPELIAYVSESMKISLIGCPGDKWIVICKISEGLILQY